MTTFRKYEFPSQEIFLALKETFLTDTHSAFVELGILREPMYSVDVLWVEDTPSAFTAYEIWDIVDDGSHTFEGLHFINDMIQEIIIN